MEFCRICMTREDLSSLFGEMGFITEQLHLVTGLQIVPNDGLPQKICSPCTDLITSSLDLRKLSHEVDKTLKKILLQELLLDRDSNTNDIENDFNLFDGLDDKLNDNDRISHNDSDIHEDDDIYQDDDDIFKGINDIIYHSDTDSQDSKKSDIKVEKKLSLNENDNKTLNERNNKKDNNKLNKNKVKIKNIGKINNKSKKDDFDINKTLQEVKKIYEIEEWRLSSKLFNINNVFKTDVKSKNAKLNKNNGSEVNSNQLIKKTGENNKNQEINKISQSEIKISDNKIDDELVNEETVKKCTKINEQLRNYERKTEKDNIELNKKLMSLAVTPYDPHKGPIQCKLCHQKLLNLRNFKNHAKTHFEPEFKCNECTKAFFTISTLKYHLQRHHGMEKRLKCDQCSYRTVVREYLQNHVWSVHTGERPFVCAECDATFRRRDILIQHLRIHFSKNTWLCDRCPGAFKSRSLLWGHQNKVHFTNFTYHCYLCTETYKKDLAVKRHLANVHGIPQDQQLKIKCVKTKKINI